jgi:hypothetical protein
MKCQNCSKSLHGCQLKFCSRSCAARTNNLTRPQESRKKQRKSLIKTLKMQPKEIRYKKFYTIYFETCLVCGKVTTHRHKDSIRKTCSLECKYRYQSIHYKPAIRGQSIYYKGFHFQSSWELSIAQELDSKEVAWEQPGGLEWFDKEGIRHLFYPDFFLPDLGIYLDPKNPQVIARDLEKLEYFRNRIELYYGSVKYLKNIIKEKIEGAKAQPRSNWSPV